MLKFCISQGKYIYFHPDFGLSTAYLSHEYRLMTDKVGTLYSMAPEVLDACYNEKCDVWSIGVVTYLLLSGKQPFWGPDKILPWRERRKEMIALIKKCDYAPMTAAEWATVSELAKGFVRSLLQLNPDDRPTPKEALESGWIRTMATVDDTDVQYESLDADTFRKDQLEHISSLRRRIWRLLSTNLNEDEILGFRAYLEVHDEDGGGLIGIKDMWKLLVEASENMEDLNIDDVEAVFFHEGMNEENLDEMAKLNYVDLMIDVLVGKARNTVEALAKSFDTLDVEGTRMIAANDLRPIMESHIPVNMLQQIWNELDINDAGMVNTSAILSLVTKRYACHYRDSIRSH